MQRLGNSAAARLDYVQIVCGATIKLLQKHPWRGEWHCRVNIFLLTATSNQGILAQDSIIHITPSQFSLMLEWIIRAQVWVVCLVNYSYLLSIEQHLACCWVYRSSCATPATSAAHSVQLHGKTQTALWRIWPGCKSPGSIRAPSMGTGTFIHGDEVRGLGDDSGGKGDLDAPPNPLTHTHTHAHTTSKWHCNPLTTYGVPSLKHKLDMETTCICIHVTAGSMSSSQPKPITERLLFSFCGS